MKLYNPNVHNMAKRTNFEGTHFAVLPGITSSVINPNILSVLPVPRHVTSLVLETYTTVSNQYVIVTEIFLTGICDLKTIDLNKTLLELGIDSMTAVEIKQTLEREFDLYLTLQEIRNLTFAGLEQLGTRNQKTEAEKQSLEGTSNSVFYSEI